MTRLFVFVFALWAQAGLAEDVRVRSGEHPTFSRLVIAFDEPTEWQIGKDAAGYEFRALRPEVNFDISGVFSKIPRKRISDIVRVEGNVLRINVACACHSESFEISPGKIVIDIKNGTDGETAPAMVAERVETPAPEPEAPKEKVENAKTVAAASTFAAQRDVLPFLGAPPAAPEPEEIVEQDVTPEPSPDTAALRSILVQEIGRAAMQGLVEADIALPKPPVQQAAPEPVAAERKAPKPAKPPQAPGLRVETAVDRDLPDTVPRRQTSQGSRCYPDRYFDLDGWRGDGPAMSLLAQHRTQLLGEFDKVNKKHLNHLIESYISLGFGREAMMLAHEFKLSGDRAAVFDVLAHIVDGEAPIQGNVLEDQLACGSDVAMWAVLSRPSLPRGEFVNTDAVSAAFSELPLGMRRHLGDPLAERFLNAGDTDTVARLFAAVDRAPGDHGPAFDLMTARIDVAEGRSGDADRILGDIVNQDVPMSPEALALRLERRNAESKAASDADLGNAEALAFEQAGTEIGSRLLRAWTISNAYSGQFGAAFAQLAVAPDDQKQGLSQALWDPLVRFAPDADFLSHAFYLIETGLAPGLPDDARLAVAQRISTLGFQAQALQALGAANPDEAEGPRLLRAKIALIGSDPKSALRHLAGLRGTKADALRAEAYVGLADLPRAVALYQAAELPEQASATAWKIGDWNRVAETGSPLQQGFAALQTVEVSQAENALAAQDVSTLASLQSLATESSDARKLLAKMLKSQSGS